MRLGVKPQLFTYIGSLFPCQLYCVSPIFFCLICYLTPRYPNPPPSIPPHTDLFTSDPVVLDLILIFFSIHLFYQILVTQFPRPNFSAPIRVSQFTCPNYYRFLPSVWPNHVTQLMWPNSQDPNSVTQFQWPNLCDPIYVTQFLWPNFCDPIYLALLTCVVHCVYSHLGVTWFLLLT